jgi:mannose/fructose/N-acetylgalactosamine-specific phosphotransferase system component IIC
MFTEPLIIYFCHKSLNQIIRFDSGNIEVNSFLNEIFVALFKLLPLFLVTDDLQ